MNFDISQMQQLLGQAKRQYEEMRQRMAQTSVEANAGAGMVWVRMNGEKQLLEVKLDLEVAKNDPDMLPDLIRAAVNDASRRVDELLKAEFGATFGGLGGGLLGNLPGPF